MLKKCDLAAQATGVGGRAVKGEIMKKEQMVFGSRD